MSAKEPTFCCSLTAKECLILARRLYVEERFNNARLCVLVACEQDIAFFRQVFPEWVRCVKFYGRKHNTRSREIVIKAFTLAIREAVE